MLSNLYLPIIMPLVVSQKSAGKCSRGAVIALSCLLSGYLSLHLYFDMMWIKLLTAANGLTVVFIFIKLAGSEAANTIGSQRGGNR